MIRYGRSIILLLLLFPISHGVHGAYFGTKVKRWDSLCPSWHIGRFRQVQLYFTIGVKGATRFGFDYEVPITRKGTDILHCAVDSNAYMASQFCQNHVRFTELRPFLGYQQFPPDPTLNHLFTDLEKQFNAYYTYTLDWLHLESPAYINVGNVLEYLSRLYLQNIEALFPDNQYLITGGVTYYRRKGTPMVGEMDIVVYNRKTCDVVAIGESKAAVDSNMSSALSKARKQLRRIAAFLDANHSQTINKIK